MNEAGGDKPMFDCNSESRPETFKVNFEVHEAIRVACLCCVHKLGLTFFAPSGLWVAQWTSEDEFCAYAIERQDVVSTAPFRIHKDGTKMAILSTDAVPETFEDYECEDGWYYKACVSVQNVNTVGIGAVRGGVIMHDGGDGDLVFRVGRNECGEAIRLDVRYVDGSTV